MSLPAIRDTAYALVKRLKQAWTKEGCDLQLAVEQALAEERKRFADLVESERLAWEHIEGAEQALHALGEKLR